MAKAMIIPMIVIDNWSEEGFETAAASVINVGLHVVSIVGSEVVGRMVGKSVAVGDEESLMEGIFVDTEFAIGSLDGIVDGMVESIACGLDVCVRASVGLFVDFTVGKEEGIKVGLHGG